MRFALAARTYRGSVEVAGALALYAVYEVVRGVGGEDWASARLHTDDIVELERSLGIYWEHGIHTAAMAVPGASALLGFLYLALHFVGTAAFLIWAHRRRPDAFPLVRTTIVLSTALALVGYVLYPAAPPRLAGLGFQDAVTSGTGINLSSDMLGALYNPIAAVPSLHFGYSLLVGAGLAALARRRWVKAVGVAYPLVMLFVIVATANHFLLDAVAGGAVVVAGWLAARLLVAAPRPLEQPVRLRPAEPRRPLTRIAA